MALEGTHLRLALDVKNKYDIKDLKGYLSGTAYPDSRNFTKIDRKLTHNPKFLDSTWPQTDFQKGWQVHLACDRLQHNIASVEIPWFRKLNLQKRCVEWDAIKVLQNINDTQYFDIQKYLDLIVYTESPNNEDIKKIKEHYAISRNLYKGKKKLTIKDGCNLYLAAGVDPRTVARIKSKAEEYTKDKPLIKIIAGLYDKMLKSFDNIIKR